MSLQDGLKLAVKALVKAVGDGVSAERLDIVTITKEKKKYKKLSKEEIAKILSESKKK